MRKNSWLEAASMRCVRLHCDTNLHEIPDMPSSPHRQQQRNLQALNNNTGVVSMRSVARARARARQRPLAPGALAYSTRTRSRGRSSARRECASCRARTHPRAPSTRPYHHTGANLVGTTAQFSTQYSRGSWMNFATLPRQWSVFPDTVVRAVRPMKLHCAGPNGNTVQHLGPCARASSLCWAPLARSQRP